VSELRPPKILLVEDDAVIREATALGLRRNGFEVVTAPDGPEGLAAFQREQPSLALLDVMLPGLDGVALCREIRRDSQIPIVFLSARSDAIDVVLGLEAGADDYVTKPFEPAVLAARLRASLRRSTPEAPPSSAPSREHIGSIELDRGGHAVTRDGEAISLTPTEYKLFVELADHAGMVLSRQVLLERVWGYGWAGDTRLVDVHIQRLRAKVEDDPANPRIVLTVRGVGYKLQR
jgi:two-component system response regulator MtrA